MDIVGIKRFLNKNKDKTLDEIISESVVNGIGNVIGNSDSPVGADTLFGLLKRGMVKSVQRGVVSDNFLTSTTVYFSAVNPSKCIVILDFSGFYKSSSSYTELSGSGYIKSFGSTSMELGVKSSGKINTETFAASWQIIEFW